MAKIFESEFHKGVMVAVVDNGDYQYQQLAPLFSDYGYGFVAPDKKLMFLDGEYPEYIQKIVEAHEVGHIIMGHGSKKDVSDEAEADCCAVILLKRCGYVKEASLLEQQFEQRHGYPYVDAKNIPNKAKVFVQLRLIEQ